MGWLGSTIGSAIGGSSRMFPTIGKVVGAGWVLEATRKLQPKKRRKRWF